MITLKTSSKSWVNTYVKYLKKNQNFILIDDLDTGINPEFENLIVMGKKTKLTAAEWVAVIASLGASGAGLWMIRLAIIDPEPTSKLFVLTIGGVMLVGVGGLNAINILTKVKPLGCKVKANEEGFEFSF